MKKIFIHQYLLKEQLVIYKALAALYKVLQWHNSKKMLTLGKHFVVYGAMLSPYHLSKRPFCGRSDRELMSQELR